jgi:CRP-like cAMP-binding protein
VRRTRQPAAAAEGDVGESIATALGRSIPASKPAIEALAAIAHRRWYAKGEYLLRGGERAECAFLIVKGLIREHYIGHGGGEHNRAFAAEGHFTGSLRDLVSPSPSVSWIQALEPTEVVAWSWARFDKLCDEHPTLERAARRVTEAMYFRKAEREHAMLALSSEQRYAQWLGEHGAIDRRISRRDLASYLGMTPEHLSRLRARRGRAAR